MNPQLNDHEVDLIRSVFRNRKEVLFVVLFGSRAKGDARPNSDVDLAVSGELSALQIEELAMTLEELPLPYKFDVQRLEAIQNPLLMDHIQRVGVKLYEKDRP